MAAKTSSARSKAIFIFLDQNLQRRFCRDALFLPACVHKVSSISKLPWPQAQSMENQLYLKNFLRLLTYSERESSTKSGRRAIPHAQHKQGGGCGAPDLYKIIGNGPRSFLHVLYCCHPAPHTTHHPFSEHINNILFMITLPSIKSHDL